MSFAFSDSDLERIASVLGTEPKHDGALTRMVLNDDESGRHLSLEILRELNMPTELADDPLVRVAVQEMGAVARVLESA